MSAAHPPSEYLEHCKDTVKNGESKGLWGIIHKFAKTNE